jgi:hypothetical protein
MIRLIVGALIGIGLVTAVLLSPLSGASAKDEPVYDEPVEIISSNETGIGQVFQDSLTRPYQMAEAEITDNATAGFYRILMEKYGLDADLSSTDEAELVRLLPDIKNIEEAALNTPLLEAGKNIRDPALARFYAELLKRHNLDAGPATGGQQQ